MYQLALLALVLAFSSSAPAASKYPLTGKAFSEFIEHPFDFALGATRDEVLKSLGPPLREAKSTQQNPHDPKVTDTFNTFRYDGLELRIGTFPGATPPANAVLLVEVTSVVRHI
jgi:hypothetical protein